MADENNSASVLKSPVLLGMIVLLLLLVVGLSGNMFMMSSGDSSASSGYGEHGIELKGLSQAIAGHASMAAGGDLGAFDSLANDRAALQRHLDVLRNGDATLGAVPSGAATAVGQIASWWDSVTPRPNSS